MFPLKIPPLHIFLSARKNPGVNNKSVEHINFDPNPSQKKRAKLDYFQGIIKAVRSSRGDFPVRIKKKESTTARRPARKAPRKSNKEESTNVKMCLTSNQHKSIRQLRSAFRAKEDGEMIAHHMLFGHPKPDKRRRLSNICSSNPAETSSCEKSGRSLSGTTAGAAARWKAANILQ